MTASTLAAAATARAQQVRQRADRPSQRRCAEQTASRATVRAHLSGVEVREAGDGGGLEFLGHATVYEQAYEMWDAFGPIGGHNFAWAWAPGRRAGSAAARV